MRDGEPTCKIPIHCSTPNLISLSLSLPPSLSLPLPLSLSLSLSLIKVPRTLAVQLCDVIPADVILCLHRWFVVFTVALCRYNSVWYEHPCKSWRNNIAVKLWMEHQNTAFSQRRKCKAMDSCRISLLINGARGEQGEMVQCTPYDTCLQTPN